MKYFTSMKAAKAIVYFFLIGISQLAWGQNNEVEEYLAGFNINDHFIVRKTRPETKKRKSEDIISEDDIKKRLLEQLNQNIKESNPILKNHSIEYWGLLVFKLDLKGKGDAIIDVLTVNKQELGSRIKLRIIKQYDNIMSSLSLKEEARLENTNQVKAIFQEVELKRNAIEVEEELLLKIAPNLLIGDEEIKAKKEDIHKSVNELRSKFDVQKRTMELEEANALYLQGRYLEAYRKFDDLNRLYDDIDFLQGTRKSEEKIEEIYSQRLADFVARKNYRMALLTLDTLEKASPKIARIFEDKGVSIKTSYFDSFGVAIENLLSHDTKSNIAQINSYLSAIRPYSEINPKTRAKYLNYTTRVAPIMIDMEIAEVNSMIYKNNFEEAFRKMQEIKTKYLKNKKIEQIEAKLQSKAYSTKKDAFLSNKPRTISIEPGYNLMSPEFNLDQLENAQVQNFNPVYHLGIYRRFGIKEKPALDESSKPKFGYSQIGVKLEYLDVNKTYFVTDTLQSKFKTFPARPYVNISLSLLLGRTLGFDIGYLNYQSASPNTSLSATEPKGFYTGGVLFYIPMGGFSLGVGSKIISDLNSYNRAQFSFNFKFNFGANKKFNKEDKNEIKNEINRISF